MTRSMEQCVFLIYVDLAPTLDFAWSMRPNLKSLALRDPVPVGRARPASVQVILSQTGEFPNLLGIESVDFLRAPGAHD
jgi:hypothetical protein